MTGMRSATARRAKVRFAVLCGALLSLAAILLSVASSTWSSGQFVFRGKFGTATNVVERSGDGVAFFYVSVGLAFFVGAVLVFTAVYLISRLVRLSAPERERYIERTTALPRHVYWLLWLFLSIGALGALSLLARFVA